MKPISVHVAEPAYEALKHVAKRQGRPVAELVREAMADYLTRQRASARSLLDIAPHPGGPLKRKWTRAELADEMRRR